VFQSVKSGLGALSLRTVWGVGQREAAADDDGFTDVPDTDNVAFAKATVLGILDAYSGKMRLINPDERWWLAGIVGRVELPAVADGGGRQREKYFSI
jgi:hypothetical protein